MDNQMIRKLLPFVFAVSLTACNVDLPGACQKDADCGPGGVCDPGHHLCAAATIISMQSPIDGAVTGGPQAIFSAKAVAPGGPTKVDITIEQPTGTVKETETVTSGSTDQIYSATMQLGAKALVSGPAVVYATVHWGAADNTLVSTRVQVTLDMDPPLISAFNSGAFWSSTGAASSSTAAVSVQVADVGAAGVLASSVQLKCNGHTYQGTAGTGTAFTFAVPVTDLGVAAGVTADVSCTVNATDKVNNVATQVSGVIHVDNTPPVLTNPVVNPTTPVGGGATIALSIDATDTGGSGPASAVVRTPIGGDLAGTLSGNTFSFTIHGSDAQAAGLQGIVTVTFRVFDAVGNVATQDVTVNVDRLAPAVISATVTPNPAPNSLGYYPRQGGLNIPVSVVVDDGAGGSGATSATLTPAGGSPISSSTGPTGSGTAKTFTFLVPTTVQTPGSAADVPFTVSAGDAAGNTVSGAAGGVLKIDDQGPQVSNVLVNGGVTVSGTPWFKQSCAGNIDIQADIGDVGSGVLLSSVHVTNVSGGATISTGSATIDGSGHYHMAVPCNTSAVSNNSQAVVSFKVVATDGLGNAQQADGSAPNVSTGSFGIDGTVPVIGKPSASAYSAVAPGHPTNATIQSVITDTGSGVDPTTVKLGAPLGPYTASSQAVDTFTWSVPLANMPQTGTTLVPLTADAKDRVGNTGTQNTSGTILIDNDPPAFTNYVIPSGSTFFGPSATPNVTVKVDVNDPSNPAAGSGLNTATVQAQVVGAPGPLTVTPTQASSTFTFNIASNSLLSDGLQGPVNFNFLANDNAGNPGTSATKFVNVDRQPPTITGFSVPAGTHGGWFSGTETAVVYVVADGGVGGSPLNTATVTGSGFSESDGGTTLNTFAVLVPGTDQLAGSETAVPFNMTVTDGAGNSTGAITGSTIPIDRKGPTITNIAINGPVYTDVSVTPNINWFNQFNIGTTTPGPDIDIQADIVDNGSGVEAPAGGHMLLVQQASSGGTCVGNGTQLDKGPGSITNSLNTYHFKVSRNACSTSGIEQSITFAVKAQDVAGNPSTVTAPKKLGLDGLAPSVTFSITYPGTNADCDVETGVVCGHDNLHFYRAGDGSHPITFTATDSGSGVDGTRGFCSISGSTSACTTSYSAPTFSFPADFSTATISGYSAATGTGTASATVRAQDLVGNVALDSTQSTIGITRIKWTRNLATANGINQLKASPIVTTTPVSQIIFAGNNASTDPIISLKPSGGKLWSAGHSAAQGTIATVSVNMAYGSDQQELYVAKDIHNLVGLHVAASSVDTGATCALGGTSSIVGAPAIVSSGANERAIIADLGDAQLWAWQASGSSCSTALKYQLGVSGALNLGAPAVAANGTGVYFGYRDGTTQGIATATFDPVNGFTGYLATALGVRPAITAAGGALAIAGNIFFGNTSNRYQAYDPIGKASVWGDATHGQMPDAITAAPTVTHGFVIGSADVVTTGDGKLYTFKKGDGTSVTTYLPSGTAIGLFTAVTAGPDGTIYFADQENTELVAMVAGTTSVVWRLTGVVSGAVGTPPTLDAANNVVYYGADSGTVYAVITDTNATPPATSPPDWPRTGYDNCNSSNASFTCQ